MARATTPRRAASQAERVALRVGSRGPAYGERLFRPNAALPIRVVGAVLVLADPALGLVLHRAGAALHPLLPGHLVAVGDVLDHGGATGGEEQQESQSLHTR